MTKKIDEFFNLPENEDEIVEEPTVENNLVPVQQNSLMDNSVFAGLKEDEHDVESDEVRKKALATFDDIMEVGRNVNPERSARLFEVAGQFLKLAQESSNSKVDKQLKAAKLKIEAKRQKIHDDMLDEISSGAEVLADRNELIKEFLSQAKKQIIDVDPENLEPDENDQQT